MLYLDKIGLVQAIVLGSCPPRAMPIWKWIWWNINCNEFPTSQLMRAMWPYTLTPHRQWCKEKWWREDAPELSLANRYPVHCIKAAEDRIGLSKELNRVYWRFKPGAGFLQEVESKREQQIRLRAWRKSKTDPPTRYRCLRLHFEARFNLSCPWHPHHRVLASTKIFFDNLWLHH